MSKQFKKIKSDSISLDTVHMVTEKPPIEKTNSQDADRHLKVRHPHSDKE